MVLFLIKMIFFAISTLTNLVSRLLFTCAAQLFLLVIYAFKVPGEAIHGGLQQVADVVRSCFEYFLELMIEVISSLISTVFDLLKEAISGSIELSGSAIGGLVESTRTSFDGLKEYLPEVLEGVSDMISTVVTDLWNNCMDAVGYVMENA